MPHSFSKYLTEGSSAITESIKTKKVTTLVLEPDDKGYEYLTDRVFGIRNESEVTEAMLEILGVPMDGTPIRIRTGFMKYNDKSKMLYFAKFKSDLPSGK